MNSCKLYSTPTGYLIVLPSANKMYWVYNTHVSVEVLNELAYEGLSEAVWDIGVIGMIDNARSSEHKLLTGEAAFDLLVGLIIEKVEDFD